MRVEMEKAALWVTVALLAVIVFQLLGINRKVEVCADLLAKCANSSDNGRWRRMSPELCRRPPHPRFVRAGISAPLLRFSHRPLPIGISRETLALHPFEQDVHAAIDGCFFAKPVVGIDLHILILRGEKRASA